MNLAKIKFTQLFQKNDLIQNHGVCVRILGDISLLPEDLQRVIARMVNVSKHNTKSILNIAFPYTSRQSALSLHCTMDSGITPRLCLALFTHQSTERPFFVRGLRWIDLASFVCCWA
jgi:ditrans,polycis-polyprenyl diphosphate synthase